MFLLTSDDCDSGVVTMFSLTKERERGRETELADDEFVPTCRRLEADGTGRQ